MSTETSFVGLFERTDLDTPITSIVIPLIQRDYAQGRRDIDAVKIRSSFVDVLHEALTEPRQVNLDFVYGDVDAAGVFSPLDGQQRLTTLFLLHWVLASQAGVDLGTQRWTSFSYATRTSARRFCERLVKAPLPAEDARPASEWITDQPWYMAVWEHDPTIASMLVMIDALEERFAGREDYDLLWERLADGSSIVFHRLAVDDKGFPDDLYIKMNSRGKPLTPFENFKARFEGALRGRTGAATFARRVDGEWTNALWRYRGDDDLIDDEFMCYLHFLTEICEWRAGDVARGGVEERAIRTFASDDRSAGDNLTFMFAALDVWVEVDAETYFETTFTAESSAPDRAGRLLTFHSPHLLRDCLARYGAYSGNRRLFDFGQTLILYAVLLHLTEKTEDFPIRARVLRNLIEASTNEVRLENMPRLVADTARIIGEPDLARAVDGSLFAKHQRDHEVTKLELLDREPDLATPTRQLEDHGVLRGTVSAFTVDAHLPRRADVFEALMSDPGLWLSLTGALLSVGDYSRQTWHTTFQFGSPTSHTWWRELLTGRSHEDLARTRAVLEEVLDLVASSGEPPQSTLNDLQQVFLHGREATRHFDWRYYFVKYDAMREGTSGIYVNASSGMGYDVVMLDKRQLNSLYRDPFLFAMVKDNPVASGVRDAEHGPRFTGYASKPRWLTFEASGMQMRCATDGFIIRPPEAGSLNAYTALGERLEMLNSGVVPIPQVTVEGSLTDTEDRVELGRAYINAAIELGL